jgi:hypothetical protein
MHQTALGPQRAELVQRLGQVLDGPHELERSEAKAGLIVGRRWVK